MRCVTCNKLLNDYESTRKVANTGQYLDMCQDCYVALDIRPETIDRKDLLHEADALEIEDFIDIDYADMDDLADYIDHSRHYEDY